jgi:hypothetical protein
MQGNMKRILLIVLVVVMAASIVSTLIGLPAAASTGSPNLTATTPSDWTHLPYIAFDATATLPPTPTDTPYSAAAKIDITFGKAINASTFNDHSFRIYNQSLNGERLNEIRIDLRTSIFEDMVFDPFGQAGDNAARDVTVTLQSGMGFNGWNYESPEAGGYNVLVLKFREFDNGDQFNFGVDVDPTSIQGVAAPGQFEVGSVGGLELVGATITATFDDGTTLTNQVYRSPNDGGAGADHSGSEAVLRPSAPEAPVIEVVGITPPVVVSSQHQTVRVSGPAGRPVTVLVVEGGQFVEGVPGGGYDLGRYEANSAITTRTYIATVGSGGTVDVPVLLTRSILPGGVPGGFNIITAVFDNHHGLKGGVAAPLVLELQ